MSSSGKLKISYEEIVSATDNFDEANLIGVGGFGRVYRGRSRHHGLIAIKRLNRLEGQGDHEYGMEVKLLSKYKHENLVSLIGYYGEGSERILAYKYEANGSLDKLLLSKDLSWTRRLQICLGAARGLRFLHDETGSEHGVIHRDIKSSNILLDENWNAKISDFGLSRIALTTSADSIIFTGACGTLGYVDPEYVQDGTLTKKSDVYSFGVVLYEVLSGKRVAIPMHPGGRPFTIKMAREHYEASTMDMMIDPHLRNQMNPASLSTFSSIAYQCLKYRREDRPTMSLVVEALEEALDYQKGITSERFELSSSSSSGLLYDVYVSFRVQKPETDIVDRLYDLLEREGLSCFKDNLREFDQKLQLVSAIKQSRSFFIIFSTDFAANTWNLYEAATIIQCAKKTGRIVIPVYLDMYPHYVDLSDVREQRGDFGKAMSIHNTDSRIGEWRNALVEATNLPGLMFSDYRDREYFADQAAKRIKNEHLRIKKSKTRAEGYITGAS